MKAISEVRYLSAGVTLLVTLIVVTPLCGLLFQCGCDWPWAGLDSGCNYYQADAEYRCPWCASMITGIIATGGAVMAAVLMSGVKSERLIAWPGKEIAIRIFAGLAVFIVMAVLAAVIAAWWQDYPLGIGRYVL